MRRENHKVQEFKSTTQTQCRERHSLSLLVDYESGEEGMTERSDKADHKNRKRERAENENNYSSKKQNRNEKSESG